MTAQDLKGTSAYKDWISGRAAIIHNVYFDTPNADPAFIVVHSDEMGKWTITRFFNGGSKINVSVDFKNLSTVEVFEKLLSDYSTGLN